MLTRLTLSLKYRENWWFRLVQHIQNDSRWFNFRSQLDPIGFNQPFLGGSDSPWHFGFAWWCQCRKWRHRDPKGPSPHFIEESNICFDSNTNFNESQQIPIKFQRMLSNFGTICRTLGSSQLHETQHVIVLHAIQPQAPLWNQHWKKKAQEFNKHRKTIYRFLMLVFLCANKSHSSRNPRDNCSVHNSFVQSWTSQSAQQHSSWEAIGRRSGAGCDVPRCGPNLCTCLAISHWLDLKTAMASFGRTGKTKHHCFLK